MAGYNLRDTLLKLTLALPNGAASTANTTAIDLGKTTKGDHVANGEFLISAPAMGVTPMANAKTMIYDIITSVNADLSSPTTLIAGAITQTGAGGVGCAAATKRVKIPTDASRYVGLKATGSAAGDATASSATLEFLA